MSHSEDQGGIAPTYTYDLGVFIGRFQPFHLGHLAVVEKSLKHCSKLVILIGSSDQPRDYFNPFTYEERMALIMTSLPPKLKPRVICRPLLDWTYNDPRWIKGVQDAVKGAREHFRMGELAKVSLAGHQKDGTSFYLKLFPQWDSLGIPGVLTPEGDRDVSASDIRQMYFADASLFENVDALFDKVLPDQVRSFMQKFSITEAYQNLVAEYEHVRKYTLPYKDLPYPPIFHTVDAVVVQSGHILLVKRRGMPGRGKWALPGGFLNPKERIEDAVYRELREETKIKVPEPVLRGCTTKHRYFDAVYRSSRGRTITEAFLIELPGGTDLPKVKGADDAEKAKWVPLSEVKRDMMFEDHWHIISVLTGAL